MIRMHKKNIAPWRMALLLTCATGFFYLIVSNEQVMAQEKPTSAPASSPAASKDEDMVFMVVEKSAEYEPNGFEGLKSFLASNLKYPTVARKQGIEGSVYVGFIVEKDGSLSEVKVVKGLSPETDAEAVRVMKLTKWIPGQQNGKIVRSRFVLPIQYALDKKGKPGQGNK